MLSHLRQHIEAAFAPIDMATLATVGPAGLQATSLPCRSIGMRLYLLVPKTSDHLVNLEYDRATVVTSDHWQVRGRARLLQPVECPATLPWATETRWHQIVEIEPARVDIGLHGGWGATETIDVETADD